MSGEVLLHSSGEHECQQCLGEHASCALHAAAAVAHSMCVTAFNYAMHSIIYAG